MRNQAGRLREWTPLAIMVLLGACIGMATAALGLSRAQPAQGATAVKAPTSAGAASAGGTPSELSSGGFSKDWLETVEDLSEGFANDLLDLSVAVRDRDIEAIGRYVTEDLDAPGFPSRHGPTEPVVKWISRRSWLAPASPSDAQHGEARDAAGGDGGRRDTGSARGSASKRTGRTEFLERLREVLDHFSEIEDVRFKVKKADFEPAHPDRARGLVAFFMIGRDGEGRREWLTGKLQVAAVKGGEGPWRLRAIAVDSMESKTAEADLFSEVGLPAGLSATLPTFGTGANGGFVYHGAAVADVNGDGLLDLAVTGPDQNYLYINEGNGKFRDESASSMIRFAPPGTGAVFVDYDNDGDEDLFLAAVGTQILLENRWIPDHKVQFVDVSEKAGVAIPAIGFGASVADVNGDGLPDIYVACYNRYGVVMPNSWEQATNGTPNLLFINQGRGVFRESAKQWGVDDSRWSYAGAFADFDGDGDQDLYVANDFGEDALFRNDGDHFTDIAAQAGVKDAGFGMGAAWGDFNNDGRLDLHVTNMSSTAGNRILKRLYPESRADRKVLSHQAGGNSLYENLGDGTFREVSAEVGGLTGGWAYGGGFVDFDNDGWEDLYSPNGFISGKSMKDT